MTACSPSLIMILIDGIGIAPAGASDPLRGNSSILRDLHPVHPVPLAGEGWAVPTRADLGVPGLPQSATGHATLLTGINAAQVLGRHHPGFPGPTLRRLIESENVLRHLNGSAAYVNAYVPIHPLVRRRNLRSATTVAAQANGQRLRGVVDILEGRALHHDFTNQILIKHGEALPELTPQQAGRALASISKGLFLTFFEYFLTDLAGHAQDHEMASDQVRRVDHFLGGLLEEVDLSKSHVLVCSDHGNLEDLSVRTHTRNPVPTLLWGPRADVAIRRIASIQDIPLSVLHLLDCDHMAHPIADSRSWIGERGV